MTCLVSLISDHLLPNYLFIQEMKGRYDTLLFVTTEKMQLAGVGQRLERTLGLALDSVKRIVVAEDSVGETSRMLEAAGLGMKDQFLVNLTGGTKMMSLGVYEFFSGKEAEFYYLPINKNVVVNVRTSVVQPLRYRLDVYEYFSLYGLSYLSEELYASPEKTMDLFDRFRKVNFNRYELPEILHIHQLDEEEQKYYSGLWFEEYVYLRIKEEKSLKDGFIQRGARIFRNDGTRADNEIDVMYMTENRLYVGECKMSMNGAPGSKPTKLLEQYMYKLAAISKDFGLLVHPYIFTLHDLKRISLSSRQAMERRMNILGIKGILDRRSFKEEKLSI